MFIKISLILFCFIMQTALAQNTNPKKVKLPNEGTQMPSESALLADETQESGRKGQPIDTGMSRFSLAANVGLHSLVPIVGLSAAFKLRPKSDIAVILNSGTLDLTEDFDDDDTIVISDDKIDISSGIVVWKEYFGRSFAVSSGLGFRQVRAGFNIRSTEFQELYVSGDVVVNSATFYLGVGNYWHLRRLIVGAEWFGVHVPLSSSSTTRSEEGRDYAEGGSLTTAQEDFEELADDLGKTQTFYLLLGNFSVRF